MNSASPTPFGDPDAFAAKSPAAPAAKPAPKGYRLHVSFSGSGSEYFRIWIVNVFLTLITLSLYAPFARARALRYFYGNTLVGRHALGFHGDPWQMFKGYVIVLVFAVAYSVSSSFFPNFAFLILMGWLGFGPLLWRATLRFRLRNTSWRGLRFDFSGSIRGVYWAVIPMLLLIMLLAGVLVHLALRFIMRLTTNLATDANGDQIALVLSGIFFIGCAILPWMLARICRYQMGHLEFAQQTTQSRTQHYTGEFYRLYALIWLVLLVMIIMFFLMIVLGGEVGFAYFLVFAAVIGYWGFNFMARPYFKTRLQNLIWNQVQSQNVRFTSNLSFKQLLRLHCVNIFLTALTLGLYYPFAKVRMAKARLEAVKVLVKGDVDTWIGRGIKRTTAIADASSNYFDLDFFGM